MTIDLDNKHVIYACENCCTKLSRKGEPCPRCHNGKGVQVYPVPKKVHNADTTINSNFCSGVRRPRKHSPKTRF